jgi:hypothetical protein
MGKTKATGEAAGAEPAAKKVAKPAAEKTVFERTQTPRRACPPEGASFRALSWNVAGLRALLSNGTSALKQLVEEERPDLLCLQEHKLQTSHVPEAEKQLRCVQGSPRFVAAV